MIATTLISGWHFPADDRDAHGVILHGCEPSIAKLLPHVKGREVIVQAGANVGVYPVALARHFHRVYTAEPHPANWACLAMNLATRREAADRILVLNGAFGERETSCAPLEVKAGNCGAHRVAFDKGTTPVWTIDGLELTGCDCIWLDIEGAELFALKGALQTILKFSPVIAVEDKGLHRTFDVPDGALQQWLAGLGYEQVDRVGNDKIFTRNLKL